MRLHVEASEPHVERQHSGLVTGFMSRYMTNRTTHRSTSGSKLYAVRDKEGKFKDIQTYKRAHGQDVKRSSKEERAKKS